MGDVLRFGVVGIRRGDAIARVIHSRTDVCVAAICDRNVDRAAEAASRYGAKPFAEFDEMLESGIDAVVVATPPESHCELSRRALGSGIHVLSEVPAVTTFEEAEALLDAARKSHAVYMIAENVCFFGNVEAMASIARSGRLGGIYLSEGEYVHDCRSLFSNRDDGLGGGVGDTPTWRAGLAPIHYCTHELGPILMISGDPVVEAIAFGAGKRTDGAYSASSNETALFRTVSGGVIRLHMAFAAVREPPFHFLGFYGETGSIETDRYRPYDNLKAYFADIDRLGGLVDIPVSARRSGAPAAALSGGHGTSEWYMVEHFVHRVNGRDEKKRLSPGRDFLGVEDALNMTVPGIAAHHSALSGGKPVAVKVY